MHIIEKNKADNTAILFIDPYDQDSVLVTIDAPKNQKTSEIVLTKPHVEALYKFLKGWLNGATQ